MNIITMASRKGGAGKSTLTAHLAALCHQAGHRTVVIDADPQGSLTLWHSLRPDRQPDLRSGARGIERALAHAMVEGYAWAFIDTAASMWVVAQEAIRAATMVLIPARPGLLLQLGEKNNGKTTVLGFEQAVSLVGRMKAAAEGNGRFSDIVMPNGQKLRDCTFG